MDPRQLTSALAVFTMLLCFAGSTPSQAPPPPRFAAERFVIKAMSRLNSAQATYAATAGNGMYGTLQQLRQAGLIDASLGSGSVYGYRFAITTGESPAAYFATAVPALYRKSGLRSYFIDQTGVLRGADKNGGTANSADPYIDSCALWGISDNEVCTVAALRGLFSAELDYAATIGSGRFGTLLELRNAGLINEILGSGTSHGYVFSVAFGAPGGFELRGSPTAYSVTGRRSFYIDQTGILRGADHQGGPATANDPPIYD